MTDQQMIAELRDYSLNCYETGGHWIYETYDDTDFTQVLYKAKNNIEEAKMELKRRWTLLEAYSNDLKNS